MEAHRMAEESLPRSTVFRAQALRQLPEDLSRAALSAPLDGRLRTAILPPPGLRVPTVPTPGPSPTPTAPVPVPMPPPMAPPVVPAAPAANPFHSLPFPAP